ncbi:beta-Ala-His dipeptidase [Entomospira culicis]|uniref:Cytosol non-specific dipeptidase n=1 Tax=Entomospira culicis TaxID=2719989 RepID=A0A968GGQ4_9SPIO|nr:beta-Ala-His dipeptidase [Entomospira culicis]NIZ18516.1 aminoacyl-histidine dipeptidase [Entomospira culicis]NIZ68732.1 aminoacyl-histidine dipeptidase [Entomospira culicis]WDI37328.1 beta-Ala-His dipeptidase [Entomospira culicis]WDI38957.1 beta-Ala-His dipeptidase [Entomospira culicis]
MYALDFFKRLTEVPRPSYHEEKARQFFIDEAKALGYDYKVDSAGNLLIRVAGAGTTKDHPVVVLQGHMDMVCEKSPDVVIDFMNDPLSIYEEDGFLKARGTTLGADNGVGVALAFYCATLDNHPPLEILLTVDEEVGMTGADKMQAGFFTGKRLINLDSGQIGVITTGSAGGDDAIITLPITTESAYLATIELSIEIVGLKGGHSGGNIGLNRLSATKILGNLLTQYQKAGFDFRIQSIDAGAAANAIARDGKMVLLFADAEQAKSASEISSTLKSGDGEQLTLKRELKTVGGAHQPFSVSMLTDITYLLSELPHGVRDWQDEQVKLPRTSSNVASIKLVDNQIKIVVSYRSFDNAMLPMMKQTITDIVAKSSAQMVSAGDYPAWPPKEQSELRAVCSRVYAHLFGQKPLEVARHVGLECGYWERLSPGVDVISIGPNLFDLHSPTERVEIATIGQMQSLLAAMMAEL